MHQFFYKLFFLFFLPLIFSENAACQFQPIGSNNEHDFLIDGNFKNLKVLDSQIVHFQHNNDLQGLAKTYELKGDYLEEQGVGISIVYYEKALESYRKIQAREDEFRLLKFLSKEYVKIDDRQKALKTMYSLLDEYQYRKDTLRIAQTYSDIGSVYADLDKNIQALDFMKKALDLSILLDKKVGQAAISNNIAGVYKDLDSINKAFESVRIAERLNHELKNDYWLSINHTMYSDLYSKLDMMDSARYYLFKSNDYVSKEGSTRDSIDLLRKTGIYYYKVDSIQKAMNMFNQGILISRKLGSLKSEANFIHWISEVYENNGKMELALSFLQIRHDLLDSLSNMQSGKRIEEYEVLYKVKSLESDLGNSMNQTFLAQSEATQHRNRFYWVLIVLLLTLLGTIVIVLLFRRQIKSNKHLLKLNVRATNTVLPKADKYVQSTLSDSKKQEILGLLVNLMVDEQIYVDQELNLDVVSQKLEVSRTYLSQVINETYSQNFTKYINSYRVNLAKTYLLSEEHDKYSIQGISEMVGFKSVSAFNTSFKKATGLTPSYYRRNGKGVK